MPVPAVDFADTTHELGDADYFFMPYIESDNLGIVNTADDPKTQDAFNEKIGALNRQLNTIRGDHFGTFQGRRRLRAGAKRSAPSSRTCSSTASAEALTSGGTTV